MAEMRYSAGMNTDIETLVREIRSKPSGSLTQEDADFLLQNDDSLSERTRLMLMAKLPDDGQ